MNLVDFAKTHNVDRGTVSKYLERHPELKEMTIDTGYHLELSNELVEILEKKYPIPKPVIIGYDTEQHFKEINDLMQEVSKRDEIIKELYIKLSEQKDSCLRLTQELHEIEKEQLRISTISDQLIQQNSEKEKQLTELKGIIEQYESLTLFQRIFKKHPKKT